MTGPADLSGPFVVADPDAQPYYTRVPSPIGTLLLTGRDGALTGLYMLGGPHGSTAQVPPGARRDAEALAPEGSEFQLAVWAELTRIPYGSTISYGTQTERIGKPLSAARAVGAANGQNPISVIVPCHRVIGADGGLTGYGGGLERKETLLRLEQAPAMLALDATLF